MVLLPTAAYVDDLCGYVGDASGQVCAVTSGSRPFWTDRGAAVQCVVSVDLLECKGSSGLGVAVGDAAGLVSYFIDGRLVCAHSLPQAIAALARHVDANGNPAVAAADVGGAILVFGLDAAPLCRLRMHDVRASRSLWAPTGPTVGLASVPTRLSAAAHADHGRRLLVVASAVGHLHALDSRGELVEWGQAPTGITALGEVGEELDGYAGADGSGGGGRARDRDAVELPLACEDGSVCSYVCTDVGVHDEAPPESSRDAPPSEAGMESAARLEAVARLGVKITSLGCSLWRGAGLLACIGLFDGVLLVSRGGGARHVLASAGWGLAVHLASSPESDAAGASQVPRLRMVSGSGSRCAGHGLASGEPDVLLLEVLLTPLSGDTATSRGAHSV